jgi:hypothetical protein
VNQEQSRPPGARCYKTTGDQIELEKPKCFLGTWPVLQSRQETPRSNPLQWQPTTHKTRQWQLKSEVAPRTESKGKIQTRTEQEMRILADALRSTETTKIGGGGLTCELRSTETTKIGGGGLTCEDQTWE